MIVYEGSSRLDKKAPIIAIATWGSKNPKTGNMVQIWIMRSDMHPLVALRTGQDRVICGDCPMRGKAHNGSDRSCYVQTMCLGAIYKKYRVGGYSIGKLPDLPIRISAYGDPCSVPLRIWRKLLTGTRSHTGYTRQWNKTRNRRYADLFHASVFSSHESLNAHTRGFKYFWSYSGNGKHSNIAGLNRHSQCDSVAEGLQCADCGKCNGSSGSNVWIGAHGPCVKYFENNVKGL